MGPPGEGRMDPPHSGHQNGVVAGMRFSIWGGAAFSDGRLIYNQGLSLDSTSSTVGEVLHLAEAQSAVSGSRRLSRRAMQMAAAMGLTACMGALAGCGNSYR